MTTSKQAERVILAPELGARLRQLHRAATQSLRAVIDRPR